MSVLSLEFNTMLRLFFLLMQIGVYINYCDCGVTKKPVHVSPELAATVLVAVQKCQPETGVDINALLMIYDGIYREDQQFKDFIYCCYKTSGFLKHGQLDQEKAINAIKNEPLVEEGIRRCGSQQGPDPKENIFKFFKCFMDTTPVRMTL